MAQNLDLNLHWQQFIELACTRFIDSGTGIGTMPLSCSTLSAAQHFGKWLKKTLRQGHPGRVLSI